MGKESAPTRPPTTIWRETLFMLNKKRTLIAMPSING